MPEFKWFLVIPNKIAISKDQKILWIYGKIN